MTSKTLLSLLADGAFHSGEALADQLRISRTAVWKQVRRASDQGYPIETVRGKGYRLTGGLDLLSGSSILAALPPSMAKRIHLIVLDETDSTNAEIGRSENSWAEGRIPVCVADMQRHGRGRRGRRWHSPRGENLYMSMGLTFGGGFSMLDGLSLVFGVAVAEALESAGVKAVGLKWPNDLFVAGAKLGGILIELRGELEEGFVRVIAGIGMNVHMTEGKEVDQNWTSLARQGGAWCRNDLTALIVESVLNSVERFEQSGFATFQESWQQRDMFSGKELMATHGSIHGVGRGIDSSGNYRLEVSGGEVHAIRAGEVSLRVIK